MAEFWVIPADKLDLPEYPTVCVTLAMLMYRFRRIAFILTLGFAQTAFAQSRDPLGISCLPADQAREVAAYARQVITESKVQQEMLELNRLVDEQARQIGAAAECKERLENPFETLAAYVDSCPSTIARYNELVHQLNAKEESVKVRKDIVDTQIRLKRSIYASCR